MFPLFDLCHTLSYDCKTYDRCQPALVKITAWKEAGERSILALYFANGHILLWYVLHGCEPITKQMPWYSERTIVAMCFDPSATWLLVVTQQEVLYIIPALPLLDPTVGIMKTWRVDDLTKLRPTKKRGLAACVNWWTTFENHHIAVLGTKLGFVLFVNLENGRVLAETDVNEQISHIDLIHSDDHTFALITTKSNSQWRLYLEVKTTLPPAVQDEDVNDFEQFQEKTSAIQSIIDTSDSSADFVPLKFHQFSSSVILSPQTVCNKKLITAHDLDNSTYQVYDTSLERSPLYVYHLPDLVENIILTDKMLFLTSSTSSSGKLLVMAARLAEDCVGSPPGFNKQAIIERFSLPADEHIVAVYKRSFPFYWFEKWDEDAGLAEGEETELLGVTQTVLQGCVIITNHSVYECRPRISPEKLFIKLTLRENGQQLERFEFPSPASWEKSSRKQHGSADVLAFFLGLDVNALYLGLANYYLKHGNVQRADHFFALCSCPPVVQVSSYAEHGYVQQMLLYLDKVLSSSSTDSNQVVKRQLSDMVLKAYLHQLLLSDFQDLQISDSFRYFLQENHYYSERLVIQLLADYDMKDHLIHFAKSRGVVREVLERLMLRKQHLMRGIQVAQTLLKQGHVAEVAYCITESVVDMFSVEDLLIMLEHSAHLMPLLVPVLQQHLAEMDEDMLHKVATLVDPSQPVFSTMATRLINDEDSTTIRRKKRSKHSFNEFAVSDLHDNSVHTTLTEIIEFFLHVVLKINSFHPNVPFLWEYFEDWWNVDKREPISVTENNEFQLLVKECPVSLGPEHLAFICDEKIYTCGLTKGGRLGLGEPEEPVEWIPLLIEPLCFTEVRAVSCGCTHTLALTDAGVYGWGESQYGQVGAGNRGFFTRPYLLETLLDLTVVSVRAGQYHSLALISDGRVYSWGWGAYGQLGQCNSDDLLTPALMASQGHLKVTTIAAGYAHSLLLTSMGEVYVCGCGRFGQLGLGDMDKRNHLVPVPGLPAVLAVETAWFHNLALTEEGELYTWGVHPQMLKMVVQNQRRARLGQPVEKRMGDLPEFTQHLSPHLIPTSNIYASIIQLCCGSVSNLLLTEDGEVFTWGKNYDGQLGVGHRQELHEPTMVIPINDRKIIRLSCGGESVVAMDNTGKMWGWGRNASGQLGIPMPMNTSSRRGRESSPRNMLKISELVTPTLIEAAPLPVHTDQLFKQGSPAKKWKNKLPDLQDREDSTYRVTAVLPVLKHLGDYVRDEGLLQLCEAGRQWQPASWLADYWSRYPQALCCHLQALMVHHHQQSLQDHHKSPHKQHVQSPPVSQYSVKQSSHLHEQPLQHEDQLLSSFQQESWSDGLTESCEESHQPQAQLLGDSQGLSTRTQDTTIEKLSLKIFDYYIKRITTSIHLNEDLEVNLSWCSNQLLKHWQLYHLDVCTLEEHLQKCQHSSQLIISFFILLTRSCAESTGVTSVASSLRGRFSTSFYLWMVEKIVREMEAGSLATQQVEALVSSNMLQLSKATMAGYDQPSVTTNKLWQEIFHNLEKDVDSRNVLLVKSSQVDGLTSQRPAVLSDQSSGDSRVVLFTCGHHFTKDQFTNVVVPEMSTILSSYGLVDSASVLSSYYNRSGNIPMACPHCVLATIKTL